MVVMDVFTRRIVGFGVEPAHIDGISVCRMFNQSRSGQPLPTRLSSDHDPLFRFHRWRANLRILDIEELLSSPGRLPGPGPHRNRMWGFPPSGSSADGSCGRAVIVYLQMDTTIRASGRGRSSSRSENLAQVRRLRWLRRLSHLNQLRSA